MENLCILDTASGLLIYFGSTQDIKTVIHTSLPNAKPKCTFQKIFYLIKCINNHCQGWIQRKLKNLFTTVADIGQLKQKHLG